MNVKNAADAFKDMTASILSDLARIALQESLTGLFKSSGIGGLLGSLFGGGTGAMAKLTPYAKGGVPGFASSLHDLKNTVVSSTVLFPFAKGGAIGAVGEAGGSEGILPLARTRSGDLGVKLAGEQLSQNAQNNNIVNNINITVDSNGTSVANSNNSSTFANHLANSVKVLVNEEIAKNLQQGGMLWNSRHGR